MGAVRGVVAVICKYVGEGATRLCGRAEGTGMVAVSEDLAAALESAVEALGEANAETLQAAAQRVAVVGLDEEVDVIALDGEVHDAKAEAVASCGDGDAKGRESPTGVMTA